MSIINQMIDEGRIAPVMDIIDSCGVPQEFILDVVLKKKIIEGDSREDTLHLEDINTSDEWKEKWLDKMCKSYAKKAAQIALLQERIYFASLLIDYRGVSYRVTDCKFTGTFDGKTRDIDMKDMKVCARELGELEPLITKIFPCLSIPITHIDPYVATEYEKIAEQLVEIRELEMDPNFLPNINRDGRNGEFKPVKDFKYTKKYGDGSSYDVDVPCGTLDDVIGKNKVESVRKIVPFGLDLDVIDTAWIAPDGSFYGKYGAVYEFIHLQIADELQETGIIPEKIENPSLWLEKEGWIKLSQGRLLANYDIDGDVTPNQRNTLKKYAEIRKLDRIVLGMIGKTYPVNELDNLTIEHLKHA